MEPQDQQDYAKLQFGVTTEKVEEIKSSVSTNLWTEAYKHQRRIKKKERGVESIENGKTI